MGNHFSSKLQLSYYCCEMIGEIRYNAVKKSTKENKQIMIREIPFYKTMQYERVLEESIIFMLAWHVFYILNKTIP